MPNLLDWGMPSPNDRPQSEPVVTATVVAKAERSPRTGRINPGRKHGEHGTGPKTYTAADVKSVRAALNGTTAEHPISVAQLCQIAGLNGRTVRSILSERDGLDFLVGCAPTGELFDTSESPCDGDGFSAKLNSQVKKMAERIRRRQAYRDAIVQRDTLAALEATR